MSAVFSISTGTLPGPTPYAGFPLEYAAFTMPLPPVERIAAVRRCRISSFVASRVALLMHWMIPSGAPAFTAAAAITAAVSQVQFFARGCGLITIALPALSEMRILQIAVKVGFVGGR